MNLVSFSNMRIVVIQDENLTFRIDSFERPTEIVVVKPDGTYLTFANRPPNVIKYVKPSCFPCKQPQWKTADMKWTCDSRHYLGYSNSTNLDAQSVLWRCVHWQTFKNHEHFGSDALLWDFVNQSELRFRIHDPADLYKDHQNQDECQQFAFLKNCTPLLRLERALIKRILAVM